MSDTKERFGKFRRKGDRHPISQGPLFSLIWAAPGAMVLLAPSVHAQWDSEKYLVYNFGQLSLRPQLSVGETYDSNIFYAETDVEDDFILSLRPGLSLVYGQKADNYLWIGYTLDASFYADRDDLNNLGHILSHQSRFQFSRWTIQGVDTLAVTKTLLGGSFSYIQRRIGLVSLSDSWKADYEISPKMILGGRFGVELADYDAADLDNTHLYDYLGYNIGVRMGYLPSEKIVVFPEMTFGQSFLSENNSLAAEAPDVNSYSFRLGMEGEFTPKLTGMVSGGYEIRDYSDDTDIPNGWVADFQLQWAMRAKTTLTAGYRHFIQVSREARAIPYTAHRPTASLIQQLGTRDQWTAVLDAYYQMNQYEGDFRDPGPPVAFVEREDDFFGAGFRVNWRWQPWLTTSAVYEFRKYSDNLTAIPDYDLHRISLRIAAGY